ncbi:MAG: hypothetical protein Q7R73_03690 [bacterium]|nr:hypothetical protein [bacterium]
MIENIRGYLKNRAFLIGFLPIFGPTLLNFPTGNLEGLAFFLEEKPSLEIENMSVVSLLAITQDSALIVSGKPSSLPQPKKMRVALTAYSSHPDETDSTPFLTASGTETRDGVIAANFLPFGTIVRIPELFGDKTFIVEDRMHRKFSKRVDIWMPTKKKALIFGKTISEIEILN